MKRKDQISPGEEPESLRLQGKIYEIQFLLGKGATSRVYCVREKDSGRVYACKCSEHREWLKAEADLLKRISHPLFPQWEAFEMDSTRAYLVMEYISGVSLSEQKKREGVFSISDTVRISRALAEGLAYLQGQNPPLIYKDLKPENVMLGKDGGVRLLDLGAAAVRKGWRIGTPGFSAPELLACKDAADPAGDVYSLGVLMAWMLTETGSGTEQKEIPSGLKHLIAGCTRTNPRERIPDARAFLDALSVLQPASGLAGHLRQLWGISRQKRYKQPVFEKNIYKNGKKQHFFM